jgi:hypothetical protein
MFSEVRKHGSVTEGAAHFDVLRILKTCKFSPESDSTRNHEHGFTNANTFPSPTP